MGGISILVTGSERHSYDAREGSTYAWRYLFQRLSASKDDEMTTFISKFRLWVAKDSELLSSDPPQAAGAKRSVGYCLTARI